MSKQDNRPPVPNAMSWSGNDLMDSLGSLDMVAHQIVEVTTMTLIAGDYPDMDKMDDTFKEKLNEITAEHGSQIVSRLAAVARVYQSVSADYMDNLIRLLVETGFLLPETADIPDEVPKDWS